MSTSSSESTGGIGFVGLLLIVFITLKLLGKITWSWWWVLAPAWAGVVFVAIVLVVVVAIVLWSGWRNEWRNKKR